MSAAGDGGVRPTRHLVVDDVEGELDVLVVAGRRLAKWLRADDHAVALAQRPLEPLEAVHVERSFGLLHLEYGCHVLLCLRLEDEIVRVEQDRLALETRLPQEFLDLAAPWDAVEDEALVAVERFLQVDVRLLDDVDRRTVQSQLVRLVVAPVAHGVARTRRDEEDGGEPFSRLERLDSSGSTGEPAG